MLTTACSLLASASALVPGVTTQPMSQLLQHRASPMEMRVHSMQPPPSDMAPRPPDDMYQVYLGTQGERPSEYVARVLMMVCDVSEDEAFAARRKARDAHKVERLAVNVGGAPRLHHGELLLARGEHGADGRRGHAMAEMAAMA